MRKYSTIIGCDISKHVIDISYHSKNDSRPIYLGQYQNSVSGFTSFVEDILDLTSGGLDGWFICFENTGAYSKKLFQWLVSNEICCREEDPIKISMSLGLRRGKSDKLDSKVICQYAHEKQETLVPSELMIPELLKIKKLLSRRTLLVKHKIALHNSIKEQKGSMDKDFYNELNEANDKLIAIYKKQIKDVEKTIDEVITSNPELKKNDDLIQSVIGIGQITSAYILAFTNNFKLFNDAKKFACYCGVAPFPNSSGTKKGRSKVSHMANKIIKSLLSNCALSTIRHDPEIAKYYLRKKEEGKESGIVFNAIKNKLLHRVFSVIKRGTPYVKIMTYA